MKLFGSMKLKMNRKNKDKNMQTTDNTIDPQNENVELTDNNDVQNAQNNVTAENNEPTTSQTSSEQANTEQAANTHTIDHTLQKQIEELNTEVNVQKDKYIRLVAEFDNYKRRTLKERSDLIKTAGEDILLNLLPVMDNFERAIKFVETAKDPEAIKEGINLIYSNLKTFLQQKGVKEIESVNQEFNTDVHEALTKIPAPAEELKGKVVDVIEKGYFLHDKVIRFAKVVIGE